MYLDILFINPPFRLIPPFKYKLVDPPRNLALLSAVLRKENYTVEILDMPILELNFDDLVDYVTKNKPKIIGILNRSTYSFPIVKKACADIKKAFPDIPTIVGGTFVSFAPGDAMNDCVDIDYIVIGEGEVPLPLLINALMNNGDVRNVPNIMYRDSNGEGQFTYTQPPIENLDSIPLPELDLLPIEKYVFRNERYILDISRGCKNACPYCTSSFHKKHVRFRSSKLVMDEIRVAYEYGFRKFYFHDDVFTQNEELVVDICKSIISEGMQITWPCMSRVGSISENLLYWMDKAGCDLIAYGIETVSKKALEEIGKSDQIELIEKTFSLTKKHNIRALAFVIFGMPKNSFVDDLNTIQFLNKLQPDAVGVFSFKPYPGTTYYSNPDKYGISILDYDFTRWSQLDEPTHETVYQSRTQIIESMLICNYLFRSGGSFSEGVKYRRRKDVLILKTEEGGLLYNPYVEPTNRKTDMYLNGIRLDPLHFEVLYRCDGYHSINDIAFYVNKLFDFGKERSIEQTRSIVNKALSLKLFDELPDIMSEIKDIRNAVLINGGGLV